MQPEAFWGQIWINLAHWCSWWIYQFCAFILHSQINHLNFHRKKIWTFFLTTVVKNLHSPFLPLCVWVCVLRERERERERKRERTESFPRPAYPKIHLSVLQTVSVFSDLWPDYFVCFVLFFFCGCTTYQSKQKCQRTMFSIIYLLRTVCELTFLIKQMHYKTGTLWHSDASILFTSAKVPSATAKVVLDKRP